MNRHAARTSDRPSLLHITQPFNESAFLPPSVLGPGYQSHVSLGYREMRQRRVVIAGLARDLQQILPLTIDRIERLGSFFAEYRVIVYENDSVDNSLMLLNEWAERNTNVRICSESRQDPVNRPARCLSRAARMAYYRSQCHRQVQAGFADFDNVILVDMDLEGGWSYDGVANTFGQTAWDFVGAYGIIFRRQRMSPNCVAHYDAWAYRVDEDFAPLSTKEVNAIHFERGEPLHPVTSCFGGLGVYQMPAYLAGRYDGSDVEHVTFHRHMRQRGFRRTFLNPSQIAVYGRKHRSLDPFAAYVLRAVDAVPGRRPTKWRFPKIDAGSNSRRAA